MYSTSVWVPYLLLVTLLTSLNMSFHASFVLHGHCLPATVHDCLVVESVMNKKEESLQYCSIVSYFSLVIIQSGVLRPPPFAFTVEKAKSITSNLNLAAPPTTPPQLELLPFLLFLSLGSQWSQGSSNKSLIVRSSPSFVNTFAASSFRNKSLALCTRRNQSTKISLPPRTPRLEIRTRGTLRRYLHGGNRNNWVHLRFQRMQATDSSKS